MKGKGRKSVGGGRGKSANASKKQQGKGRGDFVDEKDYEFSPTDIIYINSSFKSAQGKNIY